MPFIPYEVDVPYDRRPVVNWLIVSAIVVVFLLQRYIYREHHEQFENRFETGQKMAQIEWSDPFEPYVLYGWTLKGLLGHMWLHGGWLHMAGNLIFLWLFGNAVCSKIGNFLFFPIYILLGLTAAAFHQTFNGGPAIGASGAINGIAGMYLVFFPQNEVNCIFLLPYVAYLKPFALSGIWVILSWFVFDVWGLVSGKGYVAYWAHVGGFVTGFALAVLMLVLKTIEVERYEMSLLQMIGLHKKPEYGEPEHDTNMNYQQQYYVDTKKPSEAAATPEPAPLHLPEFDASEPAPVLANNKPQHDDSPAEPIKLDEPPEEQPIKPAPRDSGEKQLSQPQKQQKLEEQLVGMNCSCGETFLVPLSLSGNAAVCPRCKARVRLPEENFVRIICSCGKPFKVPVVLSGRKGICPQCKRQIKIPEKSEETACGAAFSPPLGQIDYRDTLSDDQLDEIGEILLTSKLKINKVPPSDDRTGALKSPLDQDALLKDAEKLYVRVECLCGNKFMVPLALPHREIKCPKCHNSVKLSENNFIRMNCPCGMEFKVPLVLEGRYGKCPRCNKKLKISKTNDKTSL